MIRLLSSSLIACCLATAALGCMQGAGENGGATPSPSGPATPAPKPANNDQGALKKFGGDSLQPSDYNGNLFNQKGGGPVKKGSELSCDFENVCCWQNEQSPADKLEWLLVSGSPDSSKFGSNLGSSTTPSGKFLALPVDGKAPASDAGQFYSCSIACAKDDVKVSLKHWETKGVKLQVCEKDAFDSSKAPTNCKTISGKDQGKTTTVKLPPAQFFDVVIVASNFVDSAGGLAVIDDLKVDFTPCDGSTTAKPSPSGGGGECEFACNFEKDSTCAYQAGEAQGSKAEGADDKDYQSGKWHVRKDRLGNRDTGVPGPGEKDKYAGVHLYPGQSAVLQSKKDVKLSKDRVLTFRHYEATQGIQLDACRNGESDCETVSNPDVSVADRQWQDGQINLPKSTKKVSFVARNKGQNIGAVGVDDIALAEGPVPATKRVNC